MSYPTPPGAPSLETLLPQLTIHNKLQPLGWHYWIELGGHLQPSAHFFLHHRRRWILGVGQHDSVFNSQSYQDTDGTFKTKTTLDGSYSDAFDLPGEPPVEQSRNLGTGELLPIAWRPYPTVNIDQFDQEYLLAESWYILGNWQPNYSWPHGVFGGNCWQLTWAVDAIRHRGIPLIPGGIAPHVPLLPVIMPVVLVGMSPASIIPSLFATGSTSPSATVRRRKKRAEDQRD